MVLDPYFAMKCALGENPKKGYETTRMGIAATLRNFLFQAKAYAEDPNHKFDMKLEPMVPVIRGEKALKIHCHEAIDIVTAVRICDEFHLKFTLDHVTCGAEVLDFLQKRPEIPLLLGPTLGHRGKVELMAKLRKRGEAGGRPGCVPDHRCAGDPSGISAGMRRSGHCQRDALRTGPGSGDH